MSCFPKSCVSVLRDKKKKENRTRDPITSQQVELESTDVISHLQLYKQPFYFFPNQNLIPAHFTRGNFIFGCFTVTAGVEG